jgi:hypothetical protein
LPTSEKWPAGDSGGRPPTALTTWASGFGDPFRRPRRVQGSEKWRQRPALQRRGFAYKFAYPQMGVKCGAGGNLFRK